MLFSVSRPVCAFPNAQPLIPLENLARHSSRLPSCAVAIDTKYNRVLTAGNVIRAWPIDKVPVTRSDDARHGHALVAVLYSFEHHQIVSVGISGRVRVWDLQGSHTLFEFNVAHDRRTIDLVVVGVAVWLTLP